MLKIAVSHVADAQRCAALPESRMRAAGASCRRHLGRDPSRPPSGCWPWRMLQTAVTGPLAVQLAARSASSSKKDVARAEPIAQATAPDPPEINAPKAYVLRPCSSRARHARP